MFSMNRLPIEKRVQILGCLTEGMSLRAASRLADVSINTVTKLLVDVGSMKRFARLSNGFSKKLANHEHAVAMHYMFYNLGCIHKTLRVTPAMQAGVSDHVWSLEEIAKLAD